MNTEIKPGKKSVLKSIIKTCLIAVLTSQIGLNSAGADIAVRDNATSEIEFQALAQALGHTPVAEFQGTENAISTETAELFRTRLLEAQGEWLRPQSGHKTFTAIERFLEISLDADWSNSERTAFVTFYIRMWQQTKNPDIARRLHSFIAGQTDIDLSELSPENRREWNLFSEQERLLGKPLLNLPSDVVAVRINGRLVVRSETTEIEIPRGTVRVTLLSNAFQPVSFKVAAGEAPWLRTQRQTWLTADCAVRPMALAYGATKMVGLGLDRCTNANPGAQGNSLVGLAANDRASIERFGLERTPSAASFPASVTPMSETQQSTTSLTSKPWFWGIVGVVALGAVVAVRSLDKNSPSSVQPIHRESW